MRVAFLVIAVGVLVSGLVAVPPAMQSVAFYAAISTLVIWIGLSPILGIRSAEGRSDTGTLASLGIFGTAVSIGLVGAGIGLILSLLGQSRIAVAALVASTSVAVAMLLLGRTAAKATTQIADQRGFVSRHQTWQYALEDAATSCREPQAAKTLRELAEMARMSRRDPTAAGLSINREIDELIAMICATPDDSELPDRASRTISLLRQRENAVQ